jgi:hypothetical protein
MFDPDDVLARERLFLDIDVRLTGIWIDSLAIRRWTAAKRLAFFRAAWASGYMHGLTESPPGDLLRTHGLPTPPTRLHRNVKRDHQ